MSDERSNSLIGVLTGSSRALASQLFAFYIRVPVKLFRPARIDVTEMMRRSLDVKPAEQYSFWTHSSPALLVRAIKEHGWRFIPDKYLPPIVANSFFGTVLYTSYLSSISMLTPEARKQAKLPPCVSHTLTAGAIAGVCQAIVATPLDALSLRFDADIMASEANLWHYGRDQLRELGLRAAYGGFLVNAIKESTGFAVFFASFEFVKGQMYQAYSKWWYSPGFFHPEGRKHSRILYPSFVLAGGCVSALTMQLVTYPISKFQKLHTMRLQAIDLNVGKSIGWLAYLHSHSKTWAMVRKSVHDVAEGSWFRWAYGGVWKYALYSVPSTSIGLLVFEIMRIRLIDTNPS